MKKIKILLTLLITSIVLFSFQMHESGAMYKGYSNFHDERIKEIVVTYDPSIPYDVIKEIRGYFNKWIFEDFTVYKCLILGGEKEIWVFHKSQNIDVNKNPYDHADQEPIKPDLLRKLCLSDTLVSSIIISFVN